jgi:transcriptional regulator with XRE-family HTH domain
MQALSTTQNGPKKERPYNLEMPRMLSRTRPKIGAHLVDLRKAAGLTQTDLAELVGVPQQTIAFWEQSSRPPRSEALPRLAKALGVRVEALIQPDAPRPARGGPVGKVRKLFEEVSKLPRSQQEKVVEFVSAFVDKARTNGTHSR